MSPILGIWSSAQQAAFAGSYESIATVTVGAGGSSSITFSSIPSTYKHLQIRYIAQASTSSGLYMKMNFNGDTATNYSYHSLRGDGSTTAAYSGATQAFGIGGDGIGSATSFSVGVIDLLEYANTNTYKTTRSLMGYDVNATGGSIWLISSNWRSTSAINQVVFTLSAGNFNQYSQFALYGVK